MFILFFPVVEINTILSGTSNVLDSKIMHLTFFKIIHSVDSPYDRLSPSHFFDYSPHPLATACAPECTIRPLSQTSQHRLAV
jgi:hypothetical protein